ncbi:hypothetical protein [Amycolatopsis panacis]|uniref:hypothetical protein n=1 Tax=Amycolatopsis panacis TaxID=2340917 RepID=UPI001314F4AB|nr:hypothetical protein [Amycolatopsis panacis]
MTTGTAVPQPTSGLSLLGWFTEALTDWTPQDRSELGRLLARFVDDLTTQLSTLDEESP